MALDTPFPVGVHLGCLHTGRLRGDKDGCSFAEDAVGLLAGLSGSGLQDTRVLPKHPAPAPARPTWSIQDGRVGLCLPRLASPPRPEWNHDRRWSLVVVTRRRLCSGPVAAATGDRGLGGLKQRTFILSALEPRVWKEGAGSRTPSEGPGRTVPPPRLLGGRPGLSELGRGLPSVFL